MNLRQIIITLIVILLFTPKLGYANPSATTGTDLTNGVAIVGIMAHEQEHANGGNEAQSDIVGNAAARQMAIENWFGGYETGGTQAERDNYVQQNSTDLDVRSGAASNVEYGDAFVESGWDAANLAMDAASLANNLKNKNYSGATIDAAAGILDLAALAIPAIPGGAGTAVKAARGVEVADDFVTIAKRADQAIELLSEGQGPITTELMKHPFADGATHITTTARENAHDDSLYIGPPTGTYVIPSAEADTLLRTAKSREQIAQTLGIEKEAFTKGSLVRIDIPDALDRNLSMPDPQTGNQYHVPNSGRTIGGISEATIESPLKKDSNITRTVIEGR